MKMTKLSVLLAGALPLMAIASSDVPEINKEHQFLFDKTAIQFKHHHGEDPFEGAIDLVAGYEQWTDLNPDATNTGYFQLKTGQTTNGQPDVEDRQNGVDLSYVVNRDLIKTPGLNGTLKIVHDSNVYDQRLVRKISGWVTNGAHVGTPEDPVLFQLYTASILTTHLGEDKNVEELQNQHALTFTDEGTTVYGDVINLHYRYPDTVTSFTNGTLNNQTELTVRDGAVWYGDLLTQTYDADGKRAEASKETEQVETSVNYVKNTVTLTNGAKWIGATRNYGDNASTNVTIDNSSWTVTDASNVTSLSTSSQAFITLQDGVVLTAKSLTVENSTASTSRETPGFTLRVEGLNGTSLKVTEAVTKGTIQHLEAGAGANSSGLTVEEVAQKLYSVVDGGQGTDLDGTTFAIEASAFGNAAEGTFKKDSNTNNIVANVTNETENTNGNRVSDATAITMMQWRAEATDLMERMGELRAQTATNGLWTRVTGGRNKYNGIDNDFVTFQLGYDHKLEASEDVWVGGAFSYTDGNSSHSVGSGDNHILAMTGYATWVRDNGAFLDVALRYGTLHNSFDLGVASGSFDTQALSASVETGHRFELPANTYVEPAVGLSYSHIFGESYDASTSYNPQRINQDGIDSTVARAGLRAGLKCPSNKGDVYLRAFYNYDFQGETSTEIVNYKTIDQDFGGSWYELGAGANVNFSDNLRGWADFKYLTGGEIDTPFRVTVGMRYMF